MRSVASVACDPCKSAQKAKQCISGRTLLCTIKESWGYYCWIPTATFGMLVMPPLLVMNM